VFGSPGEVKFTITAEAKLNTKGAKNSTPPEEESIRTDTLTQTLLVEVQFKICMYFLVLGKISSVTCDLEEISWC